jgi:hypothetical protein
MLFTPYVSELTELRAHMEISTSDYDAFDKLPRQESEQAVTVFDAVSNDHYQVKRAPCGLGCYCAAVIVRKVPHA